MRRARGARTEIPQCAFAGAKLAGGDQFPQRLDARANPLTGKIVVRVTPHRTAVRGGGSWRLEDGT